VIGPPAGVRVYLAAGITDMRKGSDGLAALVQQRLRQDPFGGSVYAFRGKRGDLISIAADRFHRYDGGIHIALKRSM
jgi:transposase